MIAVEVLVDKLNSFESSQEVADFLKSQKVTGRRAIAYACVISNWVQRESGVSTAATPLVVMTSEGMYDVSSEVQAFICEFDYGDYPELEDVDYQVPGCCELKGLKEAT